MSTLALRSRRGHTGCPHHGALPPDAKQISVFVMDAMISAVFSTVFSLQDARCRVQGQVQGQQNNPEIIPAEHTTPHQICQFKLHAKENQCCMATPWCPADHADIASAPGAVNGQRASNDLCVRAWPTDGCC